MHRPRTSGTDLFCQRRKRLGLTWAHHINKSQSRRVMCAYLSVKVIENSFRKNLPQLDTPLVEGIHAPNHALDEDLMLIERNLMTKRIG